MKTLLLLRYVLLTGFVVLHAGAPAQAAAKKVVRIGLYGVNYGGDSAEDFTSSAGKEESTLTRASGAFAFGYSTRYAGTATRGRGAWSANALTGTTYRIGFWGSGYTQQNGFQFSTILFYQGEFAAGHSTRYSGAGSTSLGQAAWVARASTGTTTRVGFFDLGIMDPSFHEFTNPLGSQSSTIVAFDEQVVAGFSIRYAGFTDRGQAAWVANAVTGATTRTGFTGSDYTRSDGFQSSTVNFLNGGWAAGSSNKYLGVSYLGQAAWVTNTTTLAPPIRIGLFDSAFTQTGGFQFSVATALSGGFAAGYSRQFSGLLDLGLAAFVANASTGTTIRVGLTGTPYTQAGGATPGFQTSQPTHLQGGYVAGYSTKYSGATPIGQAAWVSSVATSVPYRIGLFDATTGANTPYTKSDGTQFSEVQLLQNGFAAGYSTKYADDNLALLGRAAWLARASDGVTTRVGLFDGSGPYTASDGTQSSNVQFLQGNYAAGTSARYSGTNDNGQAVWVAGSLSGTVTVTRIGMTNTPSFPTFVARHTRNDGYQFSSLSILTETAYAAGTSIRYLGAVPDGQTAWVHDIDDNIFSPIVLSIRLSDQYAFSNILRFYSSGLAVGQYTLFNAAGTDLGMRAFAWTPMDGAFDLASTVLGGISADGWALLSEASYADPVLGITYGYGDLLGEASGTQAVYVIIPEPSSTALLAFGGVLWAVRRRRS